MTEGRPVWTSDKGSMAQETANSRWPKIVSGMIDDVEVEIAAWKDCLPRRAEGRAIVFRLHVLKEDIENDTVLRPLGNTTEPDVAGYNDQLATGGKYSWRKTPWLFAECYLYRYVQELFSNSQHWKGYDVFRRQKDSTLIKSRTAVEQMASWLVRVVLDSDTPIKELGAEPARLLFIEATALALWGNATDLSLLTDLSLEDIQRLQGKKNIEESQRNIVADDTDLVWRYLQSRKSSDSDRRIDIILDNAGFELYTDFLYISYLLESGLATSVIIHAKCFPWFVSDALPADIDSLLEHLESANAFPDRRYLDRVVACFRQYAQTGQLKVKTNPFWTTGYSFHELPKHAPQLFEDLQRSHLTVWKGDLNYRKLTGDGLWPHTTMFKAALGAVGKGTGLRVLALRTNKSDTCVGVKTEKRAEELDQEAPGKAWVRNGSYAVVSFSDGE